MINLELVREDPTVSQRGGTDPRKDCPFSEGPSQGHDVGTPRYHGCALDPEYPGGTGGSTSSSFREVPTVSQGDMNDR